MFPVYSLNIKTHTVLLTHMYESTILTSLRKKKVKTSNTNKVMPPSMIIHHKLKRVNYNPKKKIKKKCFIKDQNSCFWTDGKCPLSLLVHILKRAKIKVLVGTGSRNSSICGGIPVCSCWGGIGWVICISLTANKTKLPAKLLFETTY